MNGNEFYIVQVTAKFLQEVFELESAPEYLKLDRTGRIVKIDPSYLIPNEFYVVKGPGLEIISRMREIRNSSKYHIYLSILPRHLICDCSIHFKSDAP